jgi:hypothetical protein
MTFDRSLPLPWIEQAKARLAEHRMVIPPPEISRQSSDHLRSAIQYQLEAEQFEAKERRGQGRGVGGVTEK